MKFLTVALLVALGLMVEASVVKQLKTPNVVLPAKKGAVPDPRIVNGNEAARGQFPYQVALNVDNAWFCGGSLISDQWILTAAHCGGQSYYIRLGTNRIDTNQDGEQIIQSQTSTVHENWDPNTLQNDLCVVKIDSVQFTQYISPVKLPPQNSQDNFAGQTARVSGWGKTSDASTTASNALNYVDLQVLSNQQCSQTISVVDSQLCVSTSGPKSTCSGDSGGPLVVPGADGDNMEIGVVSFVVNGCEAGLPAGFTRVTSFRSWIQAHTGV